MSDLLSFKKSFKGDIVTPDDPDYKAAIARWASSAERRAKFVAFVKDAEDVSVAITFAKASKLPLAIRGGGHSASGASSSQDGIVIDLSRYLNGVRIDPEGKLAYTGGGALWSTVDKAAIEHGLASVAGTVNHVSSFFVSYSPAGIPFFIIHRPVSGGSFCF
jgi:FAD/FMN-containing dehydrogenase